MSIKRTIQGKTFIEDLQLANELIENFPHISILNNLFTTTDWIQPPTDLHKIEQLYRQKRQEKLKEQEEHQRKLEEERMRLAKEREKLEEKRIVKNMFQFLQDLKELEIREQQNKVAEEKRQLDINRCNAEEEKIKFQKAQYCQERKERIIRNAKKKGYSVKEIQEKGKIKLVLQLREF